MNSPKVSLVMGVYNDAPYLKTCLNNLLQQSFESIEFIIIDDASHDDSADIIKRFAAQDERICVIQHENNIGLTDTLIEGCKRAKGEYIARHDADDYSALNRLEEQVKVLDERPSVGVVAATYTLLGPQDEVLVPNITNDVARMNQIWQDARQIAINPHHGSTLFRRAIYERVGGYRREFKVAQDCDLWWRMMEHSLFYSIEQPLYYSRYHISSITAKSRKLQQNLAEKALELTQARRLGKDEKALLAEVATESRKSYKGVDSSAGEAESLYFIGACLNEQNNPKALSYARKALLKKPWNVRYYYQLFRAVLNQMMAR